jgi:hypothetical protein
MANEFVERIENILDDCRNNLPTDGVLETLFEARDMLINRIKELSRGESGISADEIVKAFDDFLNDKTRGRIVEFHSFPDNPTCAGCGSVMVADGLCFKCSNCGESSGCS